MNTIVHPYLEVDFRNGTDFFEKFVGGSHTKILGNKKFQYDFEINGNNIFLGRGKSCCYVSIDNKKADIIWFAYHKYCSIKSNLTEKQGTKHMFYHLLKIIIENFPDVEYFGLGDNVKISCHGEQIDLKYYYFLKYGKLYYQLYFGFNPAYRNGDLSKELYLKNLKLREKVKITKKEIIEIYKNYCLIYKDDEINYFINICDENMKLIDFLHLLIFKTPSF